MSLLVEPIRDRETMSTNEFVRAVLTLIDARFRDDLSLGSIARTMTMNPSHLTDTMRRYTGRPLYQWITHRRLVEARVLLRESDRSVASIAGACGYRTPEAFVRAFRRRFGCSPQAWRQAPSTRGASEPPEVMCGIFDAAHAFALTSLSVSTKEALEAGVLAGLRAIAPRGSAVIHEHDPATRTWSRFDERSEPTVRAFSDSDANVALLHLGRSLRESELETSDFTWYRRMAATRGIMAFDKIPIVHDGRCVAALAVGRTAPGELSESARAALETIGSAYGRARARLAARASGPKRRTNFRVAGA